MQIGVTIQRASRLGKTSRSVVCEKCGCVFVYQLTRDAVGEAMAPLVGVTLASQQSMVKDASERAKKELDKMLAAECEPVPCPDCGWYQEHMVEEMNRRLIHWTPWGKPPFDPNRDYPAAPCLYPGAPVPILVKRADGRSLSCYPTLENQVPDVEPEGWITVALGQQWPAQCSICAAAATKVLAIATTVDRSRPTVGCGVLLCDACSDEMMRKRKKLSNWAAVALLAVLVPSLFLVVLSAADFKFPAWVLSTGGIFVGAAIVLFPFVRKGMFEQLQTAAPAVARQTLNSTLRIKFVSSEYTEVVRRHIARQRMEAIFTPLDEGSTK